ncbi:MAG: methyltransferase domain-containing protein [Proteobacteria bacterium]|nr:methyltransferase domain-containing protein [Pseudomonadota bacterium]MBU1059239.1 methyltransferase domain-containing protein [Pseudomonadota bacterium]
MLWGNDLSFLYVIISLVVFFVLIAVGWRLFSIRASIPCPAWLSWLVELDNPFFRNNRADVIIEHLALQPGMNILDFGCGPGRLTIPLAKRVGQGGEVTALDAQSGMLQKVRAKIEAESIGNIKLLQAYSGEGKLERNAYDRVLLVTVLGEIPDKISALEEIFASLKQNGMLSVTEVIADPHFMRCRSVRQLAISAGFVEKGFYGNKVSFTMNFEKP